MTPRLRKETRDKVLELMHDGYLDVEIAKRTGVSTSTTRRIRKAIGNPGAPPKMEYALLTKTVKESLDTVLSRHITSLKDTISGGGAIVFSSPWEPIPGLPLQPVRMGIMYDPDVPVNLHGIELEDFIKTKFTNQGWKVRRGTGAGEADFICDRRGIRLNVEVKSQNDVLRRNQIKWAAEHGNYVVYLVENGSDENGEVAHGDKKEN